MSYERDIIDAANAEAWREIDRAILEGVVFDAMNAVEKLGYLANHDGPPVASCTFRESMEDERARLLRNWSATDPTTGPVQGRGEAEEG